MRKLALTLTLIATCGAACADDLTAARLFSLCNSTHEIEQAACRFYIFGVVQGAGLMDGSAAGEGGRLVQKPRALICTPDSLPQSQMVDVFRAGMKTLLQQRSDDVNQSAVSIVLSTMNRQFPCQARR